MIISPAIVDELSRVIVRPHLERMIWKRPEETATMLRRIVESAQLVLPGGGLAIVDREPTDNIVAETAVVGRADYLVSGDKDLLDLGEVLGIPIVTPADVLALLDDISPDDVAPSNPL